MSLRTRLLAFIAALVLLVMGAAIGFAHHEVMIAANDVARERLQNLTNQFATMSQQSTTARLARTVNAANDRAVRAFLNSPSATTRRPAEEVLKRFAEPQDKNGLQIELWKPDRTLALTVPDGVKPITVDLSKDFQQLGKEPFRAGALQVFNGEVVGNLAAATHDEQGRISGYLIRWRRVALNPNPEQLKQLLGNDATLYFGNANDNVWTNLTSLVANPPPITNGDLIEYQRDGRAVQALERSIPGTPWAVAVEISNEAFATQGRVFLRRMALISAVILLIGLAAAFTVSRNLTRPLKSLTEAAKAISNGDYSQTAMVGGGDDAERTRPLIQFDGCENWRLAAGTGAEGQRTDCAT